jgi:ADP-ribose pyrophosphatase YjhB (NUDIX family)
MSVLDSFSYCPRCSNALTLKTEFLHCPKCGLEFYSNPKPATALILKNSKGEYLLVKRAVDPKKGFWDLPGGFVEDNEDFEVCARRETKEELGIEVKDLKYIGSYLDAYLYQDVVYPTLAVAFLGEVKDSDVLLPDDDVASFAYFKLQDLPFDKLAFESIKQMFDSLISE